jgi:hypothetical protein
LAEALDTPGLNEATLRKASRFAQLVDAGQLDLRRLARLGVAWRTASRLTADDLGEADRQRLLRRVETGELEPARLGAEIRKTLAKAHVDNHRTIDAARDRAFVAIRHIRRAVDRRGSERAAAALADIKRLLER